MLFFSVYGNNYSVHVLFGTKACLEHQGCLPPLSSSEEEPMEQGVTGTGRGRSRSRSPLARSGSSLVAGNHRSNTPGSWRSSQQHPSFSKVPLRAPALCVLWDIIVVAIVYQTFQFVFDGQQPF